MTIKFSFVCLPHLREGGDSELYRHKPKRSELMASDRLWFLGYSRPQIAHNFPSCCHNAEAMLRLFRPGNPGFSLTIVGTETIDAQ